ncbi:phosphatase PAP2 family protein [Anaeromyxobacter oryzae]|uniref:Phosphatidic acid phosphatase type 2/haloperoxidase domain-containing protein n=1 Tax=Anaeromyxobacter oryzae TaxID=2918170 RepID=A0ABM7WUS2_9BACT|nr:phosphatase PAP2 family protein [Anaeromyxobacter oryzae]BDG03249.1 hypothetical protein AMOR_22450 [Anaeromyxobacter oryzae]
MPSIDHAVLAWLNGFAGRSHLLDAAVTELAQSNLAKGVPLAAVLLARWFGAAPEHDRVRRREIIVATFAAAGLAIVLGRLLAHAFPFRPRPVHDAALGFVPPYGGAERVLSDWSAFPSDHAMLFGAMATGLAFLSRRVGLAAHAYAAAFILLPRIYLGWHYPSDVLAGAALGIALAAVIVAAPIRTRVARLPLALLARRPGAFYAAAFVVVMQVSTLFGDVRRVLQGPFLAEVRGRPSGVAAAPAVPEPAPAAPGPAAAALEPSETAPGPAAAALEPGGAAPGPAQTARGSLAPARGHSSLSPTGGEGRGEGAATLPSGSAPARGAPLRATGVDRPDVVLVGPARD